MRVGSREAIHEELARNQLQNSTLFPANKVKSSLGERRGTLNQGLELDSYLGLAVVVVAKVRKLRSKRGLGSFNAIFG